MRPLLFLVYINDIINVFPAFLPILFADNTSVFLEDKNVDNVISRMNVVLENIVEWVSANKLSLNIDKANFMIFHINGKAVKTDLSVNICNRKLKEVDSTKFLGIIIDSTLSWFEYI